MTYSYICKCKFNLAIYSRKPVDTNRKKMIKNKEPTPEVKEIKYKELYIIRT